MRTTVLILTVALIAIMMIAEAYFQPRVDVTENRDVLLWYYNRHRERVFILLYHLH